MLTTIIIAAGAMAQAYGATAPTTRVQPPAPVQATPAVTTASAVPAVPAAVPGRMLKDLSGVTVSYYDIAGTTIPAIQLALKTALANPANKDAARLYTWDVGTQIQKATTGTKCTIQSAKSTLNAKVRLPRLAEQANVAAPVMANWTAYVAKNENDAAANLWFLTDRLRGAEQTLVGLPCDQAAPAWNARLDAIKGELSAFVAQRAAAAAAAAAAAPTAAVQKPAG